MISKARALSSGEAARLLGISTKALRLYEQHGLVSPGRTRSGWRSYSPSDIERAADVAGLRKLGLGLAEIGNLLAADSSHREIVLTRHRSRLEKERQRLDLAISVIRPAGSGIVDSTPHSIPKKATPLFSFELPWPWYGKRFEWVNEPKLVFITGPLGSGKTRLAMRLAEAMPNGRFLGLDRLPTAAPQDDGRGRKIAASPRHQQIVRQLVADGAAASQALTILVEAIYVAAGPVVVDMVEQELDHVTQEALIALLRRDPPEHPLFLMTRSSAILDLSKAESGETIIYCPANHSPPMIVRPDPSCPGYEAVATCLASPSVRARSAGVIATFAAGFHAPNNDSRETIC